MSFCDLSRAHEPGDLRRQTRRRIARLLFPAILIGSRSVTHNKIRCGLDVFEPRRSIVATELISQHEWQRHLVHLQATTDRTTIDPGVLRKAAIELLLHPEEIIEQAMGRRAISHRVERGRHVIKIARPHGMVATDGRLIRPLTTTPRRRRRSDHSTAKSLVFESFQDHRRHIELLLMLLDTWQRRDVFLPAKLIFMHDRGETTGERSTRDRRRFRYR